MEGTNHNENKPVETRPQAEGLSSLSLFNRNHHFAFIYKKTEKLVTAVYMITNFIKDNEPLKWKIRECGLGLMEMNIAFNTVSLSERRDLMKEYRALSLQIVSLSSIAYHAGLISEMNFQILSREFTNLVSIIEKDENKKANEETVILDPGFFQIEGKTDSSLVSPKVSVPTPAAEAVSIKGQSLHQEVKPVVSIGEHKQEFFPIKDIKEKALKSSDSKDDRRSIILKLLAKKSGLSIKDFADSIKGCSEKTIQRELLAMVSSGLLRKEGERRWSTYSLA
jgi:hypothetical protein